ncbi:hypothetical protein [Chryseobacterium indologenes]|uniref:hypothetical protein n=1 Tax=Chryseobacterium indologenes TaxID=253 RepID=UPI00076E34F3|nr:hypothetical protein [Chryseobacterium indologenes]
MENIELEKEELELLVGEGYSFETRFFGKSFTWRIGKLSMGKMLSLSKLSIKIKVDEESLSNSDLSIQLPAQYEAVRDNAGLLAEAVAIAVESKIPKWILKWHFLNSLNSEQIMNFSLELLKFSNYQNFMTSTVLMNGNRPTKAMPIEKVD